jgi:2-polyprenyl-3-methyl-5-hydroxy-6-metoxy-1,4-benzoquinol methylase
MKKHRLQSNFTFRLMSTKFRIRDWLRPPITILQEAGVRSGMTVLDFGCGPGGFSLAAARLVWPEGRVYVVDIHPLAVKSVQRAADKQGCNNIQTVFGGSLADVPEGNVDIALLYDVLHHLPEPDLTLLELRGVLRSKGVLSVSDHHLKEAPLRSIVNGSVHFRLIRSNRWTFQFEKTETSQVTT